MDLTNATWRKSRRSGSSGGNCVEGRCRGCRACGPCSCSCPAAAPVGPSWAGRHRAASWRTAPNTACAAALATAVPGAPAAGRWSPGGSRRPAW
ncbi:DUF397 domain-containing protein [Micromonospora orduensis]|uniref:DUF397 domain-containing protein n=1 Tax=Micromonospora orduensis TaxID=1420891 RepID=A0A5C4QXL2_9ACTN|nr:DUF397 domain-containing protein [Micromonospora orduensis]